MDQRSTLAENLRVLRAKQNLNIKDAASKIGITRETLRDLENGTRDPYPPTLARLAEGYNVSVRDLLSSAEELTAEGKVEAPSQSPSPEAGAETEEAGPSELELRGEELEIKMANKLEKELNDQLRVLRESRSNASSDRDLSNAEKIFHHWYLYAYSWVAMVRSVHPEVAGPRLEEAVNRASQAHKAEVSKTTRSTRGMPDMADVLQEWSAEQNVDA